MLIVLGAYVRVVGFCVIDLVESHESFAFFANLLKSVIEKCDLT